MEKLISGHGKRRVKRSFEESESKGHTAVPLEKNTSIEHIVKKAKDKESQDVKGMEDLRVLARQKYLTVREQQKLDLLLKELEFLEEDIKKHGWNNLSRSEQDNILMKREVVEIIREREIAGRDERFTLGDDYFDDKGRMDLEKKRQLLNKKDGYDGEKKTRQQLWEEKQLKQSVQNDSVDEIKVEGSEDYEFVFDTDALIDFTEGDDGLPEQDADYKNALSKQLTQEQNRIDSVQETRKSLPVYHYREQLLDAIRSNQVLIVVGETGSGKTTQLPQYLVEDGYTQKGKLQIACTQPRRVAATSVATRVADEMNVVLGKEVGYSIRFEDRTARGITFLKYMTDGMLLREFLTDPELSNYSCIMIDEAHERTLATDVLLGLLKDILPHRKDLKLLISSATMNATKFSQFFYDAPIFNVPGRRYPVDIHYTLQPEANYMQAAITTIFQIHTTQQLPGDILVFLTGQEEIEATMEKLEDIVHKLGSKLPPLLITPIYANLPQDQQSKIFQKTPSGCRKVVLATNIAETSLTIDGIKYVIDPGFVKENSYVPSTGMSQLSTVPCSKASVDQRAGRAGRVGPGKCFRLFTKWSYYNELSPLPKPEILRTNLSHTVLLLLSLGVTDLLNFPLLDKPSIPSLMKSLENLYVLGALNSKGTITKLGRMMCEFPCEPEFAKVLHTAATHEKCQGVLEQATTIVSMLHETASIFVNSRRSGDKASSNSTVGTIRSDHMLYLEIYNNWVDSNYSRSWCIDHKVQYKTMCRVKNVRDQLLRCCDKLGLVLMNEAARTKAQTANENNESRIARCFISGFPMNIAQLGTTGYRTVGKQKGGILVNIHPASVVFQQDKSEMKKPTKYILYQQLMLTSKEFMRDCFPISRKEWLHEMVPHYFGQELPN